MPPSPPLSRVAAWTLAVVATSTMAVSYVDRQAVAALAPTITAELHIDDAQFGWLGSAFSVAYLLFAPLAGRLVDRYGARRGLVVSVALWSLVAASHALVPGFATLFFLRILLGCAEAPSFPGAAQTVARVLPPESRSAGFGVLFTGSSVGAALAAVLAPTMAEWWGWRIALVGTAVVGLSWIPLWLLATRAPAVRAVMDTPARPTVSPEAEPAVAPIPFRWLDLLRERAVLRAVAAVVGSAPIVGLVLQFGAKLLVSAHGISQLQVRDYLWLPPLAFDGGAILFGVLASTRARREPRAPGAAPRPARGLFALAGLLCVALAGIAAATTPWQTTIAASLALAGGGGVYALATADMLSRVAPDRIAAAGGITAAAQSLALIVAFPLVGYVVRATGSYTPVALGLAIWVLPGLALWLLVPPVAATGSAPRSSPAR